MAMVLAHQQVHTHIDRRHTLNVYHSEQCTDSVNAVSVPINGSE